MATARPSNNYIPPEVQVFSTAPKSNAYNFYNDESFTSTSPIDIESNTLEFNIPGYNHRVKALNDIYVHATLQLVKSDGKPYLESDEHQPRLINAIATSLFKNAKIYFNNVLIQNIELFHLKSYLENSLNISAGNLNAQYSTGGTYSVEMTSKLTDTSKDSKVFDVYSRLNLIPCPVHLIPNVSIIIRLEWSSPLVLIVEKNYTELSTAKTTKSKIIVKDLKLFVRHYELTPSLDKTIDDKLNSNVPAIYDFKGGKLTFINIPQGVRTSYNPNILHGLMPEFIACFFIKNSTFVGEATEDIFEWTHHGISEFSFVINGLHYPRIPFNFKINNNENCFARALSGLYSAVGYRGLNKSCAVNKNNYMDKLFIIAHDTSACKLSLTNVTSELQSATYGVSIILNEPLTYTLTCCLYTITPSRVSINKDREVTVHY